MQAAPPRPRVVGRYALFEPIASGGMAAVHLGRLVGPAGFSRTVAIKRLHAQHASDPEFVSMFVDEARMAARIRHANVVPILDIVTEGDEVFLVMDYIHGESLVKARRAAISAGKPCSTTFAVSIVCGVLHGLQAAHEATDELGKPLGIIHRDVSPQNVLIGVDGIARLIDFGVAKAEGRRTSTQGLQPKGKIAYMAPEQLRGDPLDQRVDVFAASIVLWELVTSKRLFAAENDGAVITKILSAPIDPPSKHRAIPSDLETVIMRGLARNRADRFESAAEMARALERCMPLASASEIGGWLRAIVADELAERAKRVAAVESAAVDVPVVPEPEVQSEQSLKASSAAIPSAPKPSMRKRIIALALGMLALCGLALLLLMRSRAHPLAPVAPDAPPPQVVASEPAPSSAPVAAASSVPAAAVASARGHAASHPRPTPTRGTFGQLLDKRQ